MAKNLLPMKSGGGLLGKALGVLFALAVLAIVVKHPGDAASWAKALFGMLGSVVDGISSFLRGTLG